MKTPLLLAALAFFLVACGGHGSVNADADLTPGDDGSVSSPLPDPGDDGSDPGTTDSGGGTTTGGDPCDDGCLADQALKKAAARRAARVQRR